MTCIPKSSSLHVSADVDMFSHSSMYFQFYMMYDSSFIHATFEFGFGFSCDGGLRSVFHFLLVSFDFGHNFEFSRTGMQAAWVMGLM